MTAIIFDMDDTLYDRSEPFRKAYEELFENKYPAPVRELYFSCFWRGDEVFDAAQNGEMSMEEYYIYRFQKGFADKGISITAQEALQFQDMYSANQQKIEMSDTIKQLLDYCKEQGVVLGILTNGPTEHQGRKIRRLGLEKWVPQEKIVISASCGLAKPDKRIFEYAEQQMQLAGMEIYYVGDSYEKDIPGAALAGWKTIWLNKDRKELTKDMVQPDNMVYDEDGLFECIRRIVSCKV